MMARAEGRPTPGLRCAGSALATPFACQHFSDTSGIRPEHRGDVVDFVTGCAQKMSRALFCLVEPLSQFFEVIEFNPGLGVQKRGQRSFLSWLRAASKMLRSSAAGGAPAVAAVGLRQGGARCERAAPHTNFRAQKSLNTQDVEKHLTASDEQMLIFAIDNIKEIPVRALVYASLTYSGKGAVRVHPRALHDSSSELSTEKCGGRP